MPLPTPVSTAPSAKAAEVKAGVGRLRNNSGVLNAAQRGASHWREGCCDGAP